MKFTAQLHGHRISFIFLNPAFGQSTDKVTLCMNQSNNVHNPSRATFQKQTEGTKQPIQVQKRQRKRLTRLAPFKSPCPQPGTALQRSPRDVETLKLRTGLEGPGKRKHEPKKALPRVGPGAARTVHPDHQLKF